jgi:hypothetical protein
MMKDEFKDELLELAWGLIANASSGDWTKETPDWQEAAAKWRDRYWRVLYWRKLHNPK